MQKKIFLILVSFLHFSTLQAQTVLSLNSLFSEQDAVLVPQAESTWSLDTDDALIIKKAGDNFYWLQYGAANNLSLFEATFTSFGNRILLDLIPNLPDTLGDNDYRQQLQPSHSFYIVKIENDTLWVADLNYAWFYNEFSKNKNALPHTWVKNGLLLTASTGELRAFIEKHIDDPTFVKKSFSLVKDHVAGFGFPKSASLNSVKDSDLNFKQKCGVAFPLKNGWLGGDGDVSIPVNETQTLFIFSDTYVGQVHDSSRQNEGFKMVSNTVGVATCASSGNFDIQYYWGNMYSAKPQPIFRSFTNRYQYWINGAFMHDGCLYVFMPKIGPKIGAAPGDLFNFSIIGFTLAKVVNPMSNPPNVWNPELMSFSFLASYLNDVHTTVKSGNYLYLFAQRRHNETQLLRLRLDFVDSPMKHIEYFSAEHKWKPGIDTTDMAIILPESPGNTVYYHDDIKKWVMVCGPGFLENKIRLRTAPSLTGPWSKAVTVYECPEVTPGTVEYTKNNFCYLGRELIQNYDKETRTMYLTYDINNSDFSNIKSNATIYTPKIITVSLKEYGIR